MWERKPGPLWRSPHFWICLFLFLIATISHYNELLLGVPVIGSISESSLFGWERHTVDRLVFLFIISYSGWAFGAWVAGIFLGASILAMAPRAMFVSPTPTQALVETVMAILVGVLLVAFLASQHRISQERNDLLAAVSSLRLSEEKYRELFENASDAIWVHDLEGNFVQANRACERLSGYPVSELLSKKVTIFLAPEALDLAKEVKDRLLKGERIERRYEQHIKRRDGSEAIVELATRPIMGADGAHIGFQNIARDVTEERTMRDNLHFYLQKVIVAQEEERKRIARELHDDTSQSLLLLAHELDGITSDPRHKPAKPLGDRLSRLHDLTVETLTSLRRYTQKLRPAILDDIGLAAALEWLADDLTGDCGIEVEVKLTMPSSEVPREVQVVLFRIAQEALNNVRKHAGASKAAVRLESAPGKLKMTVTDNGHGFQLPSRLGDLSSVGKLGLIGMQERAQLVRGVMSLQSEPGKGTTVTVEIPLDA